MDVVLDCAFDAKLVGCLPPVGVEVEDALACVVEAEILDFKYALGGGVAECSAGCDVGIELASKVDAAEVDGFEYFGYVDAVETYV